MTKALLNILSNAHKFTPSGGAVEVKLLVLDTPGETTDKSIQIVVSDTGIGIPNDMKDKIFERFYRVETSRSRNEGGSGLGLAIVKHILEAHGENISVESVYLEGTKFSFMLEKSI